MLPVANEKQQGVSFNIRLQHVSVIIDHVHRKLTKLRHTIVLYMLVNVTCNHFPGELSAGDETHRKK